MKEKILIISGEPTSINPEIICKSWNKIKKNLKKKIYLISNYHLLSKQFKILNCKIKLKKVKSIYENHNDNSLKIKNVDFNFKNLSSLKKSNISKFINKSLNFPKF